MPGRHLDSGAEGLGVPDRPSEQGNGRHLGGAPLCRRPLQGGQRAKVGKTPPQMQRESPDKAVCSEERGAEDSVGYRSNGSHQS